MLLRSPQKLRGTPAAPLPCLCTRQPSPAQATHQRAYDEPGLIGKALPVPQEPVRSSKGVKLRLFWCTLLRRAPFSVTHQ